MYTDLVIAAVLSDAAGALGWLVIVGFGIAAMIYAVAGVALMSEINKAITAEHEGDTRHLPARPHL